MIHGFAQCSDVWFEAAFQLALNGYVVHLIDLEGYGLSSGSRICKLKVEKFHH
jgi:alpha-beta hydrolase superfamily lysophospholipase